MKAFRKLTIVAALTLPLLLTGCQDDVYEEGKVRQIAPAENPFGEGFMAPAGFDWSNSISINLNVEVKDEYSGKYKYLVEVFTSNPRINTNLAPIAAGYAQSGANYTTKITVAKSAAKIYLRQTAPSQSVSYFEYSVPTTNGSTLNCKLYNTEASTRADVNAGISGWNVVDSLALSEPAERTEPTYTVPSDAIEPEWSFESGKTYVIKKGRTFENAPCCWSNTRATVFVAGTWKLSAGYDRTLAGVDIVVLNGGKIIGSDKIALNNNYSSTLTILKGGRVECGGLDLAYGSITQNFGTLKVKSIGIPQYAVLYNASDTLEVAKVSYLYKYSEIHNHGTAIFDDISSFNTNISLYNASGATFTMNKLSLGDNSKVQNYGTMSVTGDCWFNPECTLYNEKSWSCGGNTVLQTAAIHNKGTMTIGGDISFNQNTGAVLANYAGASFTLDDILGGATIINSGYMKTTNCDSYGSSEYFYNNCTFIATNLFKWRTVVLDHGSITAGQDSEGNWLPVPTVQNYNDCNYTLKNGSIIKATTFDLSASGGNYVVGEGTSTSMVQASSVMKCNWHVYVSGNIVLDVDSLYYSGVGDACLHADGIPQTKYGESTVTIENCSGIVYEAPTVTTVETPPSPTIIGDYTGYTFAFEDKWPIYGDYDMNDAVITIDYIECTQDADEYVTEATIYGRVKAVGAGIRKNGLGIQFLGLSNASTSYLYLNGASAYFESNNNHPTVIVTDDVRHYLDSNAADTVFVNTDKNGRSHAPEPFSITIGLVDGAVTADQFDINNLDMFIFQVTNSATGTRREVHLNGYSATPWLDQSYRGQNLGNDNGGGKYVSRENMAWGLLIPSSEWRWPQEWENIRDVYKNFINWVNSGGNSYTDWWDSSNSDNVDASLLY